jgi:tripartite-type tricarboxylate transporter receptor subunit TctC
VSRLPGLPDIPSVAEAGFPDLEFGSWNGLLSRSARPGRLSQRSTPRSPRRAIRSISGELGFTPEGGSPDEFGAFVTRDLARWQRQETGIKVQ